MSIEATYRGLVDPSQRSLAALWVWLAIAVSLCTLAFSDGLLFLIVKWGNREEYSHAYLIPAISLWLLWTRRSALLAALGAPAMSGVAVLFLSLNMLVFGEIGGITLFVQVGYLVALVGLTLVVGGYSLLRVCLFPIFFLGFAIPLPTIVDAAISWRMQIISSELGVYFIRLFDVPVFLQGNVIDLGEYQLQVVEACSGLRYLYPLLSLGTLAAYFFHAPFWLRGLVVISAIPITIVMNSFRIGVIGLSVDLWGTEMADGALHFFEGWVIFMACAGILTLEIWLIARLFMGKAFFDVVGPQDIHYEQQAGHPVLRNNLAMLISSVVLIAVAYSVILVAAARADQLPERLRFVSFPEKIGHWTSKISYLEPQVKDALLGLDDYILANYSRPETPQINLYIGYYGSQRKEHGPHSPRRCIPGGGWQITDFTRPEFSDEATAVQFPISRAVIERGSQRMLVYYWFEGRGRRSADEYLSKWYIYKDSLTRGRTDGSLVRVMTGITKNETIEASERRLQQFIKQLLPHFEKFLPS